MRMNWKQNLKSWRQSSAGPSALSTRLPAPASARSSRRCPVAPTSSSASLGPPDIRRSLPSSPTAPAARRPRPRLDRRRPREMEGGERLMGFKAEDVIAGNKPALEELRKAIIYPFRYALETQRLNLKWPRILLLYGPPGTGKTSLVHAVVKECDAYITKISPYEVHKPHAGESEKFLREAFSKAYTHALSGKPSVIFIDEIDAICPRRDTRRRQQGTRMVGQLLILMNRIRKNSSLPRIVVVASTNRVDAVDPALRRAGRFYSEIEVTVPTAEERLQILELNLKNFNMKLHVDVDLKALAASCTGFVGADLEALSRDAASFAYNRLPTDGRNNDPLILKMEDWNSARAEIGPSLNRGLTKEIPNVLWDDIGGLEDLKKELQKVFEWPIKYAEVFSRLKVPPIRGVLLHGPPGCSKTTLAKASAHYAQASFFSLSGAELYSKYVGEGEALLRRTFSQASLTAPSIIFFDEVDAIASKRGGQHGNISGGGRLLYTLLTEMDGLEEVKGVTVIAATNRRNAIDAALLRPGRFDKVLYVPPPDQEGRYEILRVHTRNMRLGGDVDLRSLAAKTENFTGADLEGLCMESGMVALREDINADAVHHHHFETARASLRPSLTEEILNEYSTK